MEDNYHKAAVMLHRGTPEQKKQAMMFIRYGEITTDYVLENKYRALVNELSMLNRQQIPGSDAARITHDAMTAVSHLAEANQLLIRIEKLRAAESVC